MCTVIIQYLCKPKESRSGEALLNSATLRTTAPNFRAALLARLDPSNPCHPAAVRRSTLPSLSAQCTCDVRSRRTWHLHTAL